MVTIYQMMSKKSQKHPQYPGSTSFHLVPRCNRITKILKNLQNADLEYKYYILNLESKSCPLICCVACLVSNNHAKEPDCDALSLHLTVPSENTCYSLNTFYTRCGYAKLQASGCIELCRSQLSNTLV